MTDREWMVTAPFIPPAKRGGRRRTTDMREAVHAILYIAASGCAWRLLPKCFPPVSTVQRYFYAWRDAGLFDAINMALVMNLREIEGREASPNRAAGYTRHFRYHRYPDPTGRSNLGRCE